MGAGYPLVVLQSHFLIECPDDKISSCVMSEASHCKISVTTMRVPLIQGFPNLIPGLIEKYETKLSIFFLLKFLLQNYMKFLRRPNASNESLYPLRGLGWIGLQAGYTGEENKPNNARPIS
jgi:hypothetical protein